MYYHFIAITSQYEQGHRVAFHYSSESKLDPDIMRTFLQSARKHCDISRIAIHKLTTSSLSWESVVEADKFFENVFATQDMDLFFELVDQDQELSAYDVAKFILSLTSVSHLKLQKLLYYAYADYLLLTRKKLFADEILAFKYGPVVQDVFDNFRSYGSSKIDYVEDDIECLKFKDLSVPMALMKIISAENGQQIVQSILKTLQKYNKFTAGQLVDLTHSKNGPWKTVYRTGQNRVIYDDVILKYHHNVEVE